MTRKFSIKVKKNKLNAKVLAINGCHDASITFVDKNSELRIFEYERFCKIRYGIFKQEADNTIIGTNIKLRDDFINYVKSQLLQEPSVILYSELDFEDIEWLKVKFPNSNFILMGHHMSHCAGAYWQSGFENALVFSLDGGGRDYVGNNYTDYRSYSFYKFLNGADHFLCSSYEPDTLTFNPGIYGFFGYFCEEITKKNNDVDNSDKFCLSYAGKIMGLAAYGDVREEWISAIREYYCHNPAEHWNKHGEYVKKLSEGMGVNLSKNCFSGQDSRDLAATNQKVFEDLCLELIKPMVEKYNLDVVFSGGCALNVLLNQKLREYLDEKKLKLYIPPFPGDDGLSFGHYVYYNRLRIDPSPYCGIDIMDKDKIFFYTKKYKSEVSICDFRRIVDLICSGKIGGLMSGYSEIGPRALGNRSIICDPSIQKMKDILNSKVKFREYFRPFAPVCLETHKHIYFDNVFDSQYMSYAPVVKEEYREKLSAITHADNTARLQTVNENQHKLFYDILNEMYYMRNKPAVILNTSFNIKGKPILTSIEDAFYVLENTELDFLVIEDFLFLSK
jgi:carbamoyltransferase